MKVKKLIFSKEFIGMLVIPLLSVLAGFVVKHFQESFTWLQLAAGVAVVCVIVTISYLLTARFAESQVKALLEKDAERICRTILEEELSYLRSSVREIAVASVDEYERRKKVSTILGESFFSLDKLKKMERAGEIDGKPILSVGVMTSTLRYDVGDFADIIKSNLKKGIEYTYYYEDTDENARLLLEARELFGEGVKYRKLEQEDTLMLVEDFDFTLYTVADKEKKKEVCIMSTTSSIDNLPYHIIASEKMTNRIIHILSKYKS